MRLHILQLFHDNIAELIWHLFALISGWLYRSRRLYWMHFRLVHGMRRQVVPTSRLRHNIEDFSRFLTGIGGWDKRNFGHVLPSLERHLIAVYVREELLLRVSLVVIQGSIHHIRLGLSHAR